MQPQYLLDQDLVLQLRREVGKLKEELRLATEYQYEIPECHICGHDREKSLICSKCRPGWCLGCLNQEIKDLKAERPDLVKKGYQIAREESFLTGSWDSDSYAEICWESAETALEKYLQELTSESE